MTLKEYMRELILMDKQYGQEEELYPLINMLLRENDNVKHLSVRDVHGPAGAGMVKRLINGYASCPDLVIIDENCDLEFNNELFKDNYFKYSGPKIRTTAWEEKQNNIYDSFKKEKKTSIKSMVETQLYYMYGCVEAKKAGDQLEIDTIQAENMNIKKVKISLNKETFVINGEKSKDIYKHDGRISDFGQIVGELIWYGKVLCTNGLIWKYLEISKNDEEVVLIQDKLLSNCILKWGDWVKILREGPELEFMCVEIGNLKDAYKELVKNAKGDKLDKLKKKFYLRYNETYGWEQEWDRLKYNLACINWQGENTYNQFITEEDIAKNENP